MGWLKLTQWGRWSVVCPVANSRLWARLGGSIHRRALRDRFTNPALPAPSPPLLPPPPPSPPPTSRLYTSFPLPGPPGTYLCVRVSAKQPPESYRPARMAPTPFAIPKFSRKRFSKVWFRYPFYPAKKKTCHSTVFRFLGFFLSRVKKTKINYKVFVRWKFTLMNHSVSDNNYIFNRDMQSRTLREIRDITRAYESLG